MGNTKSKDTSLVEPNDDFKKEGGDFEEQAVITKQNSSTSVSSAGQEIDDETFGGKVKFTLGIAIPAIFCMLFCIV